MDALTARVARMQNYRVRIKAQTMACYNLATEEPHMEGRPEEAARLLQIYKDYRSVTSSERVAKREAVTEDELSAAVAAMEQAAREVFPDRCVDPPGAIVPPDAELDKLSYDELLPIAERLDEAGVPGVADGVENEEDARETLRKARQDSAACACWKLRDDPDISEDLRLRAWYWLELIDPEFNARDLVKPEEAQLWSCGKPMKRDEPLRTYSGRNEKTKLTCKLTVNEKKGCPMREARMSNDDQLKARKLRAEKVEVFRNLETSELANHKNVRPRASDCVAFRAPGSSGETLFRQRGSGEGPDPGLLSLNTDVRRIHHAKKTEQLITPP